MAMLSVNQLSSSSVLKILFPEDIPIFPRLYGGSTSFNVLDYFCGTPEISTQVWKLRAIVIFINTTLPCIYIQVSFLASGDLRNVFFMASYCPEAYHELDIHISDSTEIITARNYLITQVIFSGSFDPESLTDCQYLWDMWYGFQWNEVTRKRFVRDVKQLLKNKLSNSSVIPHGAKFNPILQKILRSWLNTVCNVTITETKNIVKQR